MKESISLDDLNLFINVVKAGSLTKASESMSIPVPTVSRRLTQLEEAVGGRLLNRKTRSISLTSLGLIYYDRCVHPLTECMMVTEHLNEHNHKLSGHIRMTAPMNLLHLWLDDCIFTFMNRYPEIKIDLIVTNHTVDLEGLNVDIAIRIGDLNDNNWISEKLLLSQNLLCASKKYIELNGEPNHPSELKNHNLICHSMNSGWSLTNQKTLESFYSDINAYLMVDDTEFIIRAAKRNLGICFIPSQFAVTALCNRELINILPGWVGNQRLLYLVFRDKNFMPSRIKVFKEHIEQYVLTQRKRKYEDIQ